MPSNAAALIMEKIDALAADPPGANPNASALNGGGFRLRVGDWRVLYALDTKAELLQVVDIVPRGRAYR